MLELNKDNFEKYIISEEIEKASNSSSIFSINKKCNCSFIKNAISFFVSKEKVIKEINISNSQRYFNLLQTKNCK